MKIKTTQGESLKVKIPDKAEKIERPEPWVNEDGSVDPQKATELVETKTAEAKDELDIFLPDPREFRDADGNIFTTMKMGWGQESKIIFRFGKILVTFMSLSNDIPDLENIGIEDVADLDLDGFLGTISIEAPDLITDTVMAMTGRDRDFVEALDTETVMDIVVPFIRRRWAVWLKVLTKYLQNSPKPKAKR